MKVEVRHAVLVAGREFFSLFFVLRVEEPHDAIGFLSFTHRNGLAIGRPCEGGEIGFLVLLGQVLDGFAFFQVPKLDGLPLGGVEDERTTLVDDGLLITNMSNSMYEIRTYCFNTFQYWDTGRIR